MAAAFPMVSLADLPSDGDRECPVCLDEYGTKAEDNPVRLPCLHIVGALCIEVWRARNPICPVCRTPLGGTTPAQRNQQPVPSWHQFAEGYRLLRRHALLRRAAGDLEGEIDFLERIRRRRGPSGSAFARFERQRDSEGGYFPLPMGGRRARMSPAYYSPPEMGFDQGEIARSIQASLQTAERRSSLVDPIPSRDLEEIGDQDIWDAGTAPFNQGPPPRGRREPGRANRAYSTDRHERRRNEPRVELESLLEGRRGITPLLDEATRRLGGVYGQQDTTDLSHLTNRQLCDALELRETQSRGVSRNDAAQIVRGLRSLWGLADESTNVPTGESGPHGSQERHHDHPAENHYFLRRQEPNIGNYFPGGDPLRRHQIYPSGHDFLDSELSHERSRYATPRGASG